MVTGLLKWTQILIFPISAYLGVVLINESGLRVEYDQMVIQIPIDAKKQIADGVGVENATKWAVNRRNEVKHIIREKGNYVTKKQAEARNIEKYQNPLGPSYNWLFGKISPKMEGQSAEAVNLSIIEGSGNTSPAVNEKLEFYEKMGYAFLCVWVLALIGIVRSSHKLNALGEEVTRFVFSILGGMSGVWFGANISQWSAHTEDMISIATVLGVFGAVLFAGLATYFYRQKLVQRTTELQTEKVRERELVEA